MRFNIGHAEKGKGEGCVLIPNPSETVLCIVRPFHRTASRSSASVKVPTKLRISKTDRYLSG
ncbi:MAG: hypothetical protein BJ554DRAFT_4945 [Olpidium bornovanus]|uniref:Uncharacterized protein n=1 Tax=Olpidium bornovanus TaxID=278681 RepID=A0A8H7ZZM9_9FUNG|nr:MAG: hypothetical protein BJ554DRAFT_4945 [Olpidium bornovanus]